VTACEAGIIVDMSRSKAKLSARIDSGLVEVKSKVRIDWRKFTCRL